MNRIHKGIFQVNCFTPLTWSNTELDKELAAVQPFPYYHHTISWRQHDTSFKSPGSPQPLSSQSQTPSPAPVRALSAQCCMLTMSSFLLTQLLSPSWSPCPCSPGCHPHSSRFLHWPVYHNHQLRLSILPPEYPKPLISISAPSLVYSSWLPSVFPNPNSNPGTQMNSRRCHSSIILATAKAKVSLYIALWIVP